MSSPRYIFLTVASYVTLTFIFPLYEAHGETAVSSESGKRFNFVIESVKETPQGWCVITPGARFDIGQDKIICHQRIAAQRPAARVTIPGVSGLSWKCVKQNSYECQMEAREAKIRLTVTGDAVLRVGGVSALTVSGAVGFDPEHRSSEDSSAIFADEKGGVGIYAPRGTGIHTQGLEAGRWEIKYPVLAERDVLVSVFPPRPFDWKQAREEVIVHYFPLHLPEEQRKATAWAVMSARPLPTDDELVEWRKVGNILVLHMEIWYGFGWENIKPVDPVRFAAVIKRAHELGWKVLPYTAPFYYHGKAVSDYENEMRHIMSYGVDGLYWDYSYMDVEKAWDVAKRARKILGDNGRLYVHCTATPFEQPRMFCPFVDTYADYILRGEMFDESVIDPLYMRYLVSGYNLSNAIGTLCYDGCRVNEATIKKVLGVNARLPFWPGDQIYNKRAYFLTPEERTLYCDRYLPAASMIRDEKTYAPWESAVQEARAKWLKDWRQDVLQRREAVEKRLRSRRQNAGNSKNMALFKPVLTSTSACYTRFEQRVPEYANDGDDTTYWSSNYAPQWWEVDLEKVEKIGRIVVRNYFLDNRFYHYEILFSSDHLHWKTAASKLNDKPATAKGDAYEFLGQQARYVRVILRHNSANIGLHLVELEVYPPSGSPRLPQ